MVIRPPDSWTFSAFSLGRRQMEYVALAAIAGIKGYPIKIMMPTSVSIERRQMLEVFGAELILTPKEGSMEAAIDKARELEAAGHWGVPTMVFEGEPFFGQDRIDLLVWRMKQKGLRGR